MLWAMFLSALAMSAIVAGRYLASSGLFAWLTQRHRGGLYGGLNAQIRREILAAAPGAIEIGDRATAIAEAVAMLDRGDVLLVAGKGHETGQTVGTTVIPFSDHDAVAAALGKEAKLG